MIQQKVVGQAISWKIVAAQLVAQSSGYWIILVLIKGEDINGMEWS